MSNGDEFISIMSRYMRARIPFVSVRSSERPRVIELLRKVFADPTMGGLSAQVHTLSQGFRDLVANTPINDERSLPGALDLVAQQVAARSNATFVFTDVPDLDADGPTGRQFLDAVNLAEERGGCLVVITSDPVWVALQGLGMTVTLDVPDIDEMGSIIGGFLDEYRTSIPIEWGPDELARASTILSGVTKTQALNAVASIITKQAVLKEDLHDLTRIKDQIFSDISGLERVQFDEAEVTVGGLAALRGWLDSQRDFLTADLRERRLKAPRGVLLVGVPGCGKSLSAKAVAASWELPLYRLDMGSILGQYVGQSENRLREALATADHVAPCVLWIDEIEKGLAGSGTDSSGVTTRLVSQFLYWLQESNGRVFVVATANDVASLPAELLRKGRFDELFFVDLPSPEERIDILRIYTGRYRVTLPEDLLAELVTLTDGFSGAEIDGSMRDVARQAVRSGDDAVDPAYVRLAFTNTLPLMKTNPERVEAIRAWGRDRAVPASGRRIESGDPVARRVVLS